MSRATLSFLLLLGFTALLACHKEEALQPPPKPRDQGQAMTLPPPPATDPSTVNHQAAGHGGVGVNAPSSTSVAYSGTVGRADGGVEGGVLGGVMGGGPQAPVLAKEAEQASALADADEVVVFEAKDKLESGPVKSGPGPRIANPEAPATQGTLRAQKATGEPLGDFPLQRTEVEAYVGGYLARTVVRQTFANPYKEAIEAVYVFPLGAMAAVHDFVMEVGSRKIVGVVRPREEAERIYAEARSRGQTASLLTQERPNIFTQNVANIEPGGTVVVSMTTFERLHYERGTYEYVFPMVVGPRYIPGGAQAASTSSPTVGGGGWAPDTTVVPDASRITPPVLKPGERSGHDIGLTVHLDAGLPVSDVASVAHAVTISTEGPSRRTVTLSPSDAIPNRDFVLRWKVSGDDLQFGLLAHRSGEEGYFTLMVQPPLQPSDNKVTPREITFILDVSGSMSGLPVETSKALVRQVMDRLRPEDCFNVVVFAAGNGQLWDRPRPGTAANLVEAKRFLYDLRGSGGTEMLAGLKRALGAAHDPKFVQMFVFCTDGYVGDEERILAFVKGERGDARFFAFGIGSSVNRFLIDGVGEVGGGASAVVMPRDEGSARRAAERFFDRIDSPVLLDVAVDWNGLPVSDVYPKKPGDLFAGGTLELVGRYSGPASGRAYVTGRLGAKRVRFPVRIALPGREASHEELAPVWARHRIHELSGEMLGADEARRKDLVKSITDLAVAYRLMSQYTAFVAVDGSRVVGDGRPVRILQPVEMPEGVSYEGVFGEAGTGPISALPAWGVRMQATRSGCLRVAEVTVGGNAAAAGVEPGAKVVSVNGQPVKNPAMLEALLLQSGRSPLKVVFEPGGEKALAAP